MAFQVSPGVVTKERDLTTIVPAVSTTVAAFAGHFEWGPVDERITVDSENELVSLFGEPKANFGGGNYAGGGLIIHVRHHDPTHHS